VGPSARAAFILLTSGVIPHSTERLLAPGQSL